MCAIRLCCAVSPRRVSLAEAPRHRHKAEAARAGAPAGLSPTQAAVAKEQPQQQLRGTSQGGACFPPPLHTLPAEFLGLKDPRLQVRLYLHPDGQRGNAPQHSVDGIYETRALSILEEATAMGVLPCYTAGKDSALDLRKIPPVLAEVYVLHVLASVSSADSSGCTSCPPRSCTR